MINIGRLCIKTYGRDAGQKCVVVDIIDKNYVLIDGNTRRRKCNIAHLEPLDKLFKINKGATTQEIQDIFKLEDIKLTKSLQTKKIEKKNEKPRKKRKDDKEQRKDTREIHRTKTIGTKNKPNK